jgi:phosphoenolpyruvate-protein kinase (PTS system EI component)
MTASIANAQEKAAPKAPEALKATRILNAALVASAIITQTGGFLSPGAIVVREYGLPAAVNLFGILDQIHDGDRLIVNGDDGTVTRIRR